MLDQSISADRRSGNNGDNAGSLGGKETFMASSCTHATLCSAPAPRVRAAHKLVRNIVIGVLAGIAVSYGEYRAIERAPGFAAACLVALSSDFKRVLDTNADDTAPRV